MDNTNVVLTLPESSFTLARCTGLRLDEPFRSVSRFSVLNTCFELENTLDEVYDLVGTSLEGVM